MGARELMDMLWRSATDEAREKAFEVTDTLLVEKDGWLVWFNSSREVVAWLRKL